VFEMCSEFVICTETCYNVKFVGFLASFFFQQFDRLTLQTMRRNCEQYLLFACRVSSLMTYLVGRHELCRLALRGFFPSVRR